MTAASLELMKGTLDMLILRGLNWGPQHGYGIARWIRENSASALTVEDRALYLALHRLEAREFVESDWGLSENNRRAKYYQLTPLGRRHLTASTTTWQHYARAVALILVAPRPTPAGRT